MEAKLVSVVVTCYNLQDKIGKCLESLNKQTYPHLEIIVIDDGSKDDSFSVIEAIAATDKRIRPVHQENQGVSATRNNGIDLATGEYLMFIDGDDYVADTYVEHFVEVADGCDMVIGALCYVYPDGTRNAAPEAEFRCDKQTYVEKYYTQSVAKRTIFGPVNKLYRTALVQENHVRFPVDLAIREDGIFVLDVLAHCRQLCGIGYAEYYYIQSAPNESLVSKFHPDEKQINQRFFRMLVDVIGEENLTDQDILSIYPMFLNMDISSIRKLYNSKEYTLSKGLRYIRSIQKDKTFRAARRGLRKVNFKRSLKYYRPLWMVHAINYLAARKTRR